MRLPRWAKLGFWAVLSVLSVFVGWQSVKSGVSKGVYVVCAAGILSLSFMYILIIFLSG